MVNAPISVRPATVALAPDGAATAARSARRALAGLLHRLRARCIAGLTYDSVLLIFCPLLSLALCWGMTGPAFSQRVHVLDSHVSIAVLLGMSLTQGHLLVTVARSHLNGGVLRRYPLRLLLGPALLVAVVLSSSWAWALGFVLMVFWDVYHSSMQTFGLGRIYDAKAGNDPLLGRRLDMVMNVVLYGGPVLAGMKLMQHVDVFERFEDVSDASIGGFVLHASTLADLPGVIEEQAIPLRWLIIGIGLSFTAFYLWRYRALAREGYVLPWQKACLMGSTALVSLLAWGFNSFGMAFLIMNIFHAVQYFALVWWTERAQLGELFGVQGRRFGRSLLLLGFLGLPLGAGLVLYTADGYGTSTTLMVCALLHFWFDGFIWSVRKREHLQVA